MGTVAQRREGMIVNAYQQSPYALHAYLPYLGQSAIVAEPLLYRDRLVGVLLVAHAQPGRHFTPQDRELLTVLAAQAAVAIENARLFEDSTRRQAWLATIWTLTSALRPTRTWRVFSPNCRGGQALAWGGWGHLTAPAGRSAGSSGGNATRPDSR